MTLRSALFAFLLIAATSALAQQPLTPEQQLAHDILKELVEINTSTDLMGTERAAQAVVTRLRAAGFSAEDAQIQGEEPKRSNVVIRLRGRRSDKPLLVMAHLDVVPARREDWSYDPFQFTEHEGYYYGRGVKDDKLGDTTIIANMIRWKREGFVPDRDVIALLTCDEETTGRQGIQWLIEHVPVVRQADFVLNADAGGGEVHSGKRTALNVQASEKIYADYEFVARDRGGHSSQPRPADNPIYRIARALEILAAFQFPVNLNDVTRTYFQRMGALEGGQVGADMQALAAGTASPDAITRLSAVTQYNSQMRTTCVATMTEGGHATNALPQMAKVNVNCRILPNDDLASVQRKLTEIFSAANADLRVASAPKPSPASPLRPDLMHAVEQLAARKFPGAVVLPEMSAGATDGLFVRNAGVPVYGALALFDDPAESRSHGRDERIPIASFYDCVDFWHDLIPALTGGGNR
jgi:acetylornithine deacetylase/succinyl-diaminopimelate desuccinylase-like protein